MEPAAEGRLVGRLSTGEVDYRYIREEDGQHRTDAVDGYRHVSATGRLEQTRLEGGAAALEGGVEIGKVGHATQGGDPGRHGERVPRKGAGLIDPAHRRDLVHQFGRSTIGADREATADDLAPADEIGIDPVALHGPSRGQAEPGHDLVGDEQGAVAAAEIPEPLEETGCRGDNPHVTGDRLEDHGRDLVREALEQGSDCVEVVVGGDQSGPSDRLGYPVTRRHTGRESARAGGH